MKPDRLFGVTTPFSSSLKQELLLFDKLVIWTPDSFTYENFWDDYEESRVSKSRKAELDWLENQNLLIRKKVDHRDTEKLGQILLERGTIYEDEIRKLNGIYNYWMDELRKRALSIQLNELENINAIPILIPEKQPHYLVFNQGVSEVLHIIFKELPIIDETTPLESIVDYCNDGDATQNRLGLRTWMNKVIREKYSINEIEDELAYRIHSYEKSINFHKMKYKRGVLEILLKLPFEITEDIIKLRFEKLINRFFFAHHNRLRLEEAELSAPFPEIAYLVKTNKHFRS